MTLTPTSTSPRRGFGTALVLLLSAALAVCGGDSTGPGDGGPGDGGPAAVATVEVTPGADTLTALGATRSFSAVARDADGNTLSDVAFTWSSSDEGVATVSASGEATAVSNGAAEITATADGVSGTAPLAVHQLVATVTVTPATATLTTVDETVQFSAASTDANGNAVEDARFLWQSSNQDVATVDTLGRATGTGSGEATITAAAEGVPGHAALTLDQTADRLRFRTKPGGAVAGEALSPAVQVEVVDASGNRVADAEPEITLALGTNPGGAALAGTKTVHAVDGVATFSGLSLEAAASGYTLQATAEGVGAGTSATFSVSAAAPARLGFTTDPADATAGEALSPAVEVAVRDAYGNTVTDATEEVALTLERNPGDATLLGTTTASAASGIASFADLALETAAAGYTLRASAAGLEGTGSGPFGITAAAKAKLGFHLQPGTAEGQEPFTVEVAIQDAYGNTVPDAGGDVTLGIAANPSGGTLSGTATAAAQAGVATYSDLSIELPGRSYTLEATSDALTPATSEAFDVRLTFVQHDAGKEHTCAVTAVGHAYCWGAGFYGQLGHNSTANSPVPAPVVSGLRFATVSAGAEHTCGVTLEGPAYCWGQNSAGQLGNIDVTLDSVPHPVMATIQTHPSHPEPAVLDFTAVSAGTAHTCGTTDDPAAIATVYCWGGDYTTDPYPTDFGGGPDLRAVSVGQSHTCGIAPGDEAYCWGSNLYGQLGDSTTTHRSSPTLVSGGFPPFAAVAAGKRHTCAVSTDELAYCWGWNEDGQLGDGGTAMDSVPQLVLTGLHFDSVAAGGDHSCGLDIGGAAYCWGLNTHGQLGDGESVDRSIPGAVLGGHVFAALSAGGRHTCGITLDGSLFCWGDGHFGQLGDGRNASTYRPVRVTH